MIKWIGKNRHIYAEGFQVPFRDALPSRRWSITSHSVSVDAHSDLPPENTVWEGMGGNFTVENLACTISVRLSRLISTMVYHVGSMHPSCDVMRMALLWSFSQKCCPSLIIREREKHTLQNVLLKILQVIKSKGSLGNCHSFSLN